MIFRQLFDRESSTFTYLIGDAPSGEAALIDPVVGNVDRDLRLVDELGLRLVAVFDTHVHADHVTGAGSLRERTGAKTHFSARGGPACADVLLEDESIVFVGGLGVRAVATPGHTDSCMSYVVGDRVFTGDALLVRGCGRTDFQEGDSRTLWQSVQKSLFTLPDATYVCPAHDYGGYTCSTIGEEKRLNPRLGAPMTCDGFVELMGKLQLPPPAKMSESVPANKACGKRT